MAELFRESASRLAQMIRDKEVRSREVAQSFLDRINAVNGKINALVFWEPEKILEATDKADEHIEKGAAIGPLHGVPVSIKDNIQVKAMPCTCGTTGLADFVPTEDGTAVARLKKAGAIILGKTNIPELGMSGETDNSVYGLTRNPYDLDRTSGGSSGGEAALIACGGSPLGIGSDLGGSIRWPSHCCGIAGLKPTTGRVSRAGNVPPSRGINHYLAQNGPMARTVADLELCYPSLPDLILKIFKPYRPLYISGRRST